MQDLVLMAHALWRWVVVAILIVAAADGLAGVMTKREWRPSSGSLARVMAIVIDIQVALGLVLYVVKQEWTAAEPFYKAIHPAIMLGVLVVAHVTAARVKSVETPRARYTWLAVGALVALLLAFVGGALQLA